MGCDCAYGAAAYGYSIDCEYFSLDHKRYAEKELIFETQISDGQFFVPRCWRLFCKDKSNADDESLKTVECAFVCLEKPCDYESPLLEEYCRFIFGYEIKPGVPLEKLKKLPVNLTEKIAKFVYLLSETETFVNIDEIEEESEFKINMDILVSNEAVKKISSLKKNIPNADFVIGCY